MKPAFSVLFFTVTSGIGYGLLVWLLGYNMVGSQPIEMELSLVIIFIGLVFATLGLLSSTLHLANPKNAWRAFSRFRTSWLSREGVFALLFYPVILAYAGLLYFGSSSSVDYALQTGLALLAIAIAVATVYCTGMIYASLKPIRQWHHPLVTPIYLLLSAFSGLVLFVLILVIAGESAFVNSGLQLTLILGVVCALVKLAYFVSIGRPEGLSIETATGFSQAQVKLLDAGHNADTFLTKEFVFKVEARRLQRLRWLAGLMAFMVPILCIAIVSAGMVQTSAGILLLWLCAFLSLYVGLIVERWLFFAEARHVVRLYHGEKTS